MDTRLNEVVGKSQELSTTKLQAKKSYLGRDVKPTSMKNIDKYTRNNNTPPKSKLSKRMASDDSE